MKNFLFSLLIFNCTILPAFPSQTDNYGDEPRESEHKSQVHSNRGEAQEYAWVLSTKDTRPLPFPGDSNVNQLIVNKLDGQTALSLSSASPRAFKLVLNRKHLRPKNNVTDEAILYLVRNGRALGSLALFGGEKVSADALLLLAYRLKNLRGLTLRLDAGRNDVALAFVQNNPHLNSLTIDSGPGIRDATIYAVAKLACLRKLKLASAFISDAPLIELAGHSNILETLELSSYIMTDAAMKAIGSGCPNLTQVMMWNTPNVGNEGIVELARCSKLAALIFSHCQQLNDDTITKLAGGCSNLQVIWLPCQTQITNNAVIALSKGCSNLHQFFVSSNDHLTSAALACLLSGCPRLGELSLEGCSQIGKDTFSQLKGPYPHPLTLSVQDCNSITDAGIRVLAQSLPQLRSLDMKYCHKITGSSVKIFSARCLELSYLSLGNNARISNFAVATLRNSRPKLYIDYKEKAFFGNIRSIFSFK